MRASVFMLAGVILLGCEADPSNDDLSGATETLGDGDGDGDGDGNGDGEPHDPCEYIVDGPLWFLEGAAAPDDDVCEDFMLTGTVTGGGAGSWTIENCPCGSSCDPDPYQLTISNLDGYGALEVGTCVTIEAGWNADCTARWNLIRDATDGTLRFALRGGLVGPTEGLPELTVSDSGPVLDCGNYEVRQVEFTLEDQVVDLWHGEQSTVVTSVGSFTITNIDSRDESDAEPFSFWAVVRNGL